MIPARDSTSHIEWDERMWCENSLILIHYYIKKTSFKGNIMYPSSDKHNLSGLWSCICRLFPIYDLKYFPNTLYYLHAPVIKDQACFQAVYFNRDIFC